MLSLNNDRIGPPAEVRILSRRELTLAIVAALAFVVFGGAWLTISKLRADKGAVTSTEVSSQKRSSRLFYPSPAQWATLTVEPVERRDFRSEFSTEGKIAVN